MGLGPAHRQRVACTETQEAPKMMDAKRRAITAMQQIPPISMCHVLLSGRRVLMRRTMSRGSNLPTHSQRPSNTHTHTRPKKKQQPQSLATLNSPVSSSRPKAKPSIGRRLLNQTVTNSARIQVGFMAGSLTATLLCMHWIKPGLGPMPEPAQYSMVLDTATGWAFLPHEKSS